MNQLQSLKVAFFVIAMVMQSFFLSVQAQTKVDTLVNEFEQASKQQRLAIANRLFQLLYKEEVTDSLLVFTSAVPDELLKSEVYYWVGEMKHFNDLDFVRSADYFERAIPLIPQDSLLRLSDCLNDLSVSYARMGIFTRALDAAVRTLELDERIGDKERIVYSLHNLGSIYLLAKQPLDAAKYEFRSLELTRELNDSVKMAVRLGALAEMEQMQGNYEKAFAYAEDAFVLDSLRHDQMKMAVRKVQMANALAKQGRTDEACRLLGEANPVLRTSGNIVSLAICLNQQGYCALMKERWMESAAYYEEAFHIYRRTGDRNSKLNSLWGLWHSFAHLDSDQAFAYMENYSLLKDSIYQENAARMAADYNARYENDQLARKNEEVTRRNRLLTFGGAAVLFVLLIVIALLVYGLRQKSHATHLQQVLRESRDNNLTNKDVEFLNVVEQLLAKQMRECNVNLEQMASDLCITRLQLNRKMKALLGESMRDHVNRVRIELACRLLDEGEKTISEVARACGIDDVAYFSRFFRKMKNMSPSEYLAQSRKDS